MKIDMPNYDERETIGTQIIIHPWDTWSMDHTLSLIILPMLKQLKQTQHGAPAVDYEDVPEELHPFSDEITHRETDKNYFKRWEYVLDEMIYAFDCKANKDEVYMRFDTSDKESMDKEQNRISNGFRLFGKYYEGLWD